MRYTGDLTHTAKERPSLLTILVFRHWVFALWP